MPSRPIPTFGGPDFKQFDGKQTFSGADIMVVFSVPGTQLAYLRNRNYKLSTEVQTITMSSTTSVLPVRRCGESRPVTFTKGGRTFAGSLVFTILGTDPFKDVFATDALNSSSVNDGSWHIDQMPAFDILIIAQNETGGVGVQIISNARIVNWGSTFSVDDMYTESSYTYVAEEITPFLTSTSSFQEEIPYVDRLHPRPKTPDDEYNNGSFINHTTVEGQLAKVVRNFQPNTFMFLAKNTMTFSDPAIPQDLEQRMQDFSDIIV